MGKGSIPTLPRGLGAPGRALWRDVLAVYGLRPDELRVLEQAARALDLIGRLERELAAGKLMVLGSMGQRVANPIIGELRGERGLFARLMKQLGLPDEAERAMQQTPGERSTRARAAAMARWSM